MPTGERGYGNRLVLVAMTLVAILFAWRILSYWRVVEGGGDPWQTGDWLINYAGGVVRRGGLGQIIFSLATGSSVLKAAFAVQAALLGLFVALCLALLWWAPRSAGWFALTLSPAFVLFPLLSPEGGLRKELIGLSGAAWLAVVVRRRWRLWAVIPAGVLFVIGCSSHEVTSLMTPFFVFMIVLGARRGLWSHAKAWVAGCIFIGVALAWTVEYLRNPGTADQIVEICDSWKVAGIWSEPALLERFCSGALAALDDGTLAAIRQTGHMFPSYFTLIGVCALSLVPFYVIRPPRVVGALAVVTLVALLPVFVLGVDYGRWIFVAVSLVSLACLGSSAVLAFPARAMPWWAAVLFVSLWAVPYTGPAVGDSLVAQVLTPVYQAVAEALAGALNLGA